MRDAFVAANLAGVCAVSTLYGIFFLLFCTYVYLVVRDEIRRKQRSPRARSAYRSVAFIGSILLFVNITMHWIVLVYQASMAFVYFEGENSAFFVFADMGSTPYVMVVALSAVVVVIADCLLIYRLWIIWDGSRRVIVFPILGVVAAAASIGVVIHKGAVYEYGDSASLAEVNRLLLSPYACTFVTNLYSSGFIWWKLWSSSRTAIGLEGGSVHIVTRALIVFMESAALYMTSVFVCLLAAINGSNAEDCLGEALIPLTGIAFMLINVRVKLGYSMHSPGDPVSRANPSARFGSPEAALTFTDGEGYELSEATKREG